MVCDKNNGKGKNPALRASVLLFASPLGTKNEVRCIKIQLVPYNRIVES